MASISKFKESDIRKDNTIFSAMRSTLESAFYGNNVKKVSTLEQAYELAKESAGTVETKIPVYNAQAMGLKEEAVVIGFNDGAITGRYAKARVLMTDKSISQSHYEAISREAIYHSRTSKLYHAEAVIGLDEEFMIKAHLLVPQGHGHLLYNWMLNFQHLNNDYFKIYKNSMKYDEGDIYVVGLPDYYAPNHEDGLSLFDTEHNCALLCGLRYFGEFKKASLSLAWNIANRNGYVSCHGGLKQYHFSKENKYTVGIFGLSGSGKSTLTHDKHEGRYDVSILHDDAYVISTQAGSSIALEPSYFDKTSDYPTDHPANKYLLSVQNVGFTKNDRDETVIVTEDIRNGNGRAIKSQYWTDNRVNKIDESIDAIIWLMKDETLPPVLKITDPVLASVMGATLATKRTTAERIEKGVDINSLVIEPYANPFRTYPLKDDYEKFKSLFENKSVACYILNTGHFEGKKVTKDVTLKILEGIALDDIKFKQLGNFKSIETAHINGYHIEMSSEEYKDKWINSIKYRKYYLMSLDTLNNGNDKLPDEALESLLTLEKQLI